MYLFSSESIFFENCLNKMYDKIKLLIDLDIT